MLSKNCCPNCLGRRYSFPIHNNLFQEIHTDWIEPVRLAHKESHKNAIISFFKEPGD